MTFLNHCLLALWLLIPLGGAATVAIVRRITVVRRVALGTTLAAFAISFLVLIPFRWRQALTYDQTPRGSVKLAARVTLSTNLEYHVAIDGLSFPFLVFTTLIFVLWCAGSCQVESNGARYFATLLALEFAALGAYLSFDFLMLSLFMALLVAAACALVHFSAAAPAIRNMLTLFLMTSLVSVSAALLAIREAGWSFDLLRLADSAPGHANGVVIVVAITFLIWMAIVPMHSWLVIAAGGLPATASIAITTTIPIAGAYGFIRVIVPLFAHAGGTLSLAFAVLGSAGILYGGLCALASIDLREFVAYSIMSVTGFVLLAAVAGTPGAVDGAVLLLIGNGLAGAMMLLLSHAAGRRASGESAPLWTAFFAIAWLAWLVAPVTLGEIIVLLATADKARSAGAAGLAGYALAIIAAGILVQGISAARMARRAFLPNAQIADDRPVDLTSVDILILSVLSAVAILLGIAPTLLCFTFTHPAARALLKAP